MTIDSVNSKTSKLRNKQVTNNAQARITTREGSTVVMISQSNPKFGGAEKPTFRRSKTNPMFQGRNINKKNSDELGPVASKARNGRRSSMDTFNVSTLRESKFARNYFSCMVIFSPNGMSICRF